jgi:hypothetical protein
MALNPHFSTTSRNGMLNDLVSAIGTSALFTIYAGGQPADVSSATTAGNTVVASLLFPSTNAFASATGGVITANTITSDTNAGGGTAAWFSIRASTGARIADGSVGTSGADLNLNSTTIGTGATVTVSAFTITIAA